MALRQVQPWLTPKMVATIHSLILSWLNEALLNVFIKMKRKVFMKWMKIDMNKRLTDLSTLVLFAQI